MKKFASVFAVVGLVLAGLSLHGCHDDYDASGPGAALGEVFVLTDAGRLLNFASNAPGTNLSAATLTGLDPDDVPVGMDFRPVTGTLYVLTKPTSGADAKLYIVQSVSSGAVTEHCTLIPEPTDATNPYTGLTGTEFGVDFDPTLDRLRVVSDINENLRINTIDTDTPGGPNNDTVCEVTTLTTLSADATGMAHTNPWDLFGSSLGACSTREFYLDSANLRLLAGTGDPDAGQLAPIGDLFPSGTVAAVNGFDISMQGINAINVGRAVLDVGSGPTLYTIDTSTGAATEAGGVGAGALDLNAGEDVVGMSIPFLLPYSLVATTQPRGELTALTTSNELINFNRRTPDVHCRTPVTLSGLGTGDVPIGLEYDRDGRLILVTDGTSRSRLYVVDPSSGVATPFCDLNPVLGGASFGVDVDATTGLLTIVSDTEENVRVTLPASAAAFCASTTGGTLLPAGAVTAASYRARLAADPTDAAPEKALFGIDSTSDSLVRIGADPAATSGACPATIANPDCGVVNAVGALGVNIGAGNGFEVDSSANVGLLAATLNGGTTGSTLFRVNLGTGAATALGTFPGRDIRALTFTAAPAFATVYAVTDAGDLVRLSVPTGTAAAAPATISSVTSIGATGLGAGVVLGLDFRLATGDLIAVTSTGLYSVNQTTGAATLVETLSGTAPAGTNVGAAFDPVADILRVVSGTQNLNIAPSDGTVTSETTLSAGSAFAAAYTNRYAGAASTVLYTVDAAGDRLMRFDNPATGAVTAAAVTFGLDVTDVGGFDIAGNNAYALAVLQVGGVSGLYRINLSTGAATPAATDPTIRSGASPITITAMAIRPN